MATHIMNAYRGVPYRIESKDAIDWGRLDPKNRALGPAVFLGYRLQRGSHRHINYSAENIEFAESKFKELISRHHEKVLNNFKSELDEGEWENELSCYGASSESDIRQMFQDQVAQALTEGDIEALVRFLKYTEVDFIHHKLTGPVQGNEAETFYFNEAGKKINDTERETYTRNLNHINNWLWGRAYSAAVPLKESATLMEIGPPEHEDSSVMKFIRSEIDMLLENKNGNYVVTADHAELCNGYIGFDARRPVEINVKSIKRAQTIARWFEGNALVNSRTNEHGR